MLSVNTSVNGDAEEAKPLHIALLWHTVFNENLGVGALTLANAELIARAAERAGYRPVLHLLGTRGGADYRHELAHDYDFTNLGIKGLVNPFSSLSRLLRKCPVAFDIGGGDSFSDIYAGKRFWMMIGSKIAVARAGSRLVLSPQTIGPFHTPAARRAASFALKRVDRVFARDGMSYDLLKDLGFADKSTLTTDVAFALPFRKPDVQDLPLNNERKLRFGMNVSSLLYRAHRSPHKNIRLSVDYVGFIDRILERLAADSSIELHFVGHVNDMNDPAVAQDGHYDDDYSLARELHARYPASVLAPKFTSPVEAKSYIAGLDVLAGSRMHATIAAISSDTAVIPLGYSRKFSGLFDSIGYSRNIDLTSESEEVAMQKFEAALANVPALREEAIAANAEAQRRLQSYVDFLDSVISDIARRHA